MARTTEAVANRNFMDGVPGFYVVNAATEIAVSGPHSYESPAFVEVERRNRTLPAAPLEVVMVDEEKC